MKQLVQDTKAGAISVVDVPPPAVVPGALRVRTVCSVISPGTERNIAATAKESLLRTARNRPDLVRRVVDMVQRDGVMATWHKVDAKRSEPKALGYSSAGVVEAVGGGIEGLFAVGDRVACAGQGVASHAEVVSVPSNLAAKIPDGVAFDQAAFATIGAIALHGVRQAEPTLGERIGVIGLGLVGQLTVQILKANGARVAAWDLDTTLVDLALAHGAELGAAGGGDEQVRSALAWTDGVGVDAVIVCASSADEAPMTAAARMCRDRARVVAVGFVPHGLPREIAYPKELALRISRSYGPGRYDAAFEEHGVDYPIGYVRWTETRNLEAFLHLLSTGQVTTSDLITDRMPIDRAASAYDRLLDKHGPRPVGMVIDYAAPPEPAPAPRPRPVAAPIPGRIGLAFVGAGSFAKGVLLPTFSADDRATLRTVCTAHGLTAWDAQKRFGFAEATTDLDHVWSDPDVRLVVITTRHDRHADLAVRALEAGKHVFVEKPLAIDAAGLERVAEAARRGPGLLLVGFNRRFAPQAVAARAALAGLGPVFVHCRVNAGALPAGHWIDDPTVGGGRMIGEGCHFVDLASALCGDPPIAGVQARALGRPVGLPEDFAVQVSFSDGSVAQITYLSRGAPSLAKERIEAHAGGVSVVIDDWRSCEVHAGGRVRRTKGGGKGHEAEISALLAAVARGGPSPIPLEVLLRVTETTFRVHTALAEPC